MKIDIAKFNQLLNEGWLINQIHPNRELIIWNYSKVCQFEKHWTPETLMARGLVTDQDGNVIAKTFDKFFNLGEIGNETIEELAREHGKWVITEKYDGSLIMVFWYDGKWEVASRGSFISEQKEVAEELLNEAIEKGFTPLPEGVTHVFEVIYPQNRIVVNYGNERRLIYLTTFVPYGDVFGEYRYRHCEDFFPGTEPIEKMEDERPNHEGYVLRFRDGFRVKVKHSEYVRLHRLITGLSEKRIWEYLSSGKTIEEILVDIPEEFEKWVRDVEMSMRKTHNAVITANRVVFEQLKSDGKTVDKKTFALAIKDMTDKPVLFAMFDNKPDAIETYLWKMVKPFGSKTFKIDEE